jgi:hypothetical protein
MAMIASSIRSLTDAVPLVHAEGWLKWERVISRPLRQHQKWEEMAPECQKDNSAVFCSSLFCTASSEV